MKKKLIFCICIVLVIILCIGSMPISASSSNSIYDPGIEITSHALYVVNLETDTVVYEKNSDKSRYLTYLCNIMTYLVVCNNTSDLSKEVTIKEEVLSMVKNSDGTLKPYVGKKMTIKDLLYVLLLTNGTDASYVLADYVTKGDIPAFVDLMNKKATSLGCEKTKFSSVEAVFDTSQITTCRDMYKIIDAAVNTELFFEISGTSSYIPEKYEENDKPFKNTNSLVNPNSPYYFKHVYAGKFGYDKTAKANVVAISEYAGTRYACIIMGASNDSEHNAFTEAKRLLSWAYQKLGDKQLIKKETVLNTVYAQSPWGMADVQLTAGKDIIRTVPVDYSSKKLSVEFDETYTAIAPIFKGQNMGTAKLYYDGVLFEEINLVSKSSVGVSMYEDLNGFISTMVEDTLKD